MQGALAEAAAREPEGHSTKEKGGLCMSTCGAGALKGSLHSFALRTETNGNIITKII